MTEHKVGEMTVNSSASSVILILMAFSRQSFCRNFKLSAEFYDRKSRLLGCMIVTFSSNFNKIPKLAGIDDIVCKLRPGVAGHCRGRFPKWTFSVSAQNIVIRSEAHFHLKTLIVHPCCRRKGAVTDLCTGDATGIPTLSRTERRV